MLTLDDYPKLVQITKTTLVIMGGDTTPEGTRQRGWWGGSFIQQALKSLKDWKGSKKRWIKARLTVMVGLAHRALQPCQKEKSVWILLASKHVINSSVLSDKLSIGPCENPDPHFSWRFWQFLTFGQPTHQHNERFHSSGNSKNQNTPVLLTKHLSLTF